MSEWSSPLISRRAVLSTGAASIASLTGCSALSSQPSTLDLLLFNHAESPYTVELSLLRVDTGLPRSDARVYSESIDVEPETEVRREGVVERQQYLVRYEVYENDSKLTDEDHVHYYPVDGWDDDWIGLDIHPPGVITRR